MTLENALETQAFTLSAPSGTGVHVTEISWRTDEELITYLSTNEDPLVIELCERLRASHADKEHAKEELEKAEKTLESLKREASKICTKIAKAQRHLT